MNNAKVIIQVSQKSGISKEDCKKLLDSLEDVISQELSEKGWKKTLFGTVYRMLSFVKNKIR